MTTEAIKSTQFSGDVVQFPLPKLGTPDSDLYDSSREGTESFPQLARLILVKMIEVERNESGSKFDLQHARYRATNKFLDFVAENAALSDHLSLDDLSKLTGRSPLTISERYSSRQKKSA